MKMVAAPIHTSMFPSASDASNAFSESITSDRFMLLMEACRVARVAGHRLPLDNRSAIPKPHLGHIASASLHRVEKSQEVALTRLVPQPSLSLIQTRGVVRGHPARLPGSPVVSVERQRSPCAGPRAPPATSSTASVARHRRPPLGPPHARSLRQTYCKAYNQAFPFTARPARPFCIETYAVGIAVFSRSTNSKTARSKPSTNFDPFEYKPAH